MRYIEYPTSAKVDSQKYYMVKVYLDSGIYTLADRLDIRIMNKEEIEKEDSLYKNLAKQSEAPDSNFQKVINTITNLFQGSKEQHVNQQKQVEKMLQTQKVSQMKSFVDALNHWAVTKNQGVAISKNAGTAFLLNIRETMKRPSMLILYSFFVMAATYHAFNGLWTFCITWGITLSARSQALMRRLSTALMILIAFLGLIAVWGSYLINLKH